jgi:hypothetical protein
LPAAPTGLTATAGSGAVTLSWTAPASAGSSAIADYTVEYSSDAGATWTPFARPASTVTSTTVTGLVNGTGYLFRVAAVNAAGAGAASATASATPADTPPTLAATGWGADAVLPTLLLLALGVGLLAASRRRAVSARVPS